MHHYTCIFQAGFWLAGSCAASQSEAMLENFLVAYEKLC